MRVQERVSSLRWLVAAAAVHALLLLSVWRPWTPAPHPPVTALPRDAVVTEIEVAVDVQDSPKGPGVEGAGVAAAQPLSMSERAPGTARSVQAAPLSDAPSAPEQSSTAIADEEEASASAVASTTPPQPPLARAPGAAPTRSLAELGYGKALSAAVQPYLEYSPLAAAQGRLDRNLAQAALDQDRNRSQGIEGPVTSALRQAAYAVVAPDSLAKVALIIDADGKLADFRIVSSNQDPALLRKLAEGLARQLAATRIRVPNGRAVEFTYEVKSEVLLPSGRAPGVNVSVLGLPVKKGRSAKSSQVSILPLPSIALRSSTEPDPDRNGQTLQTPPAVVLSLPVFVLDADLVDIGAVGRQVVHTRLVRQRVL